MSPNCPWRCYKRCERDRWNSAFPVTCTFPTKPSTVFFQKILGADSYGSSIRILYWVVVSIFVLFSPWNLGKMNSFWRAYFSQGGLVQPPTRLVFAVPNCHLLPKNWVILLVGIESPSATGCHSLGRRWRERNIYIYTLGFQPPLKQWVEPYNHHCLPKGFNHRNGANHYFNGGGSPGYMLYIGPNIATNIDHCNKITRSDTNERRYSSRKCNKCGRKLCFWGYWGNSYRQWKDVHDHVRMTEDRALGFFGSKYFNGGGDLISKIGA